MKKFEIQYVTKIASTNTYLSELAKCQSLSDFYCVMADFQTQGKGMGKNRWESEKGKNILSSLIIYPTFLIPEKQFYISKIVALSIREVVEEITNHKEVFIKWPNDIYVGEKKIAGVLIENSFLGQNIQYSIIGIGVNVNQIEFSSTIPNPISIKMIAKSDMDIEFVVERIIDSLHFYYGMLEQFKFQEIDHLYHNHLLFYDLWVNFKINQQSVKAKVLGTNEYGFLKLQYVDESLHFFDIKEVEWLF